MAPSSKCLSFFFLIFLISSFAQIQARESKFFSKFKFHQHLSTTSTSNNPKEITQLSEADEEEPSFTPQTGNGYGLYGHVSDPLPSTTAPAYPPDACADTPTAANPPDTYANMPSPAYAPDTYTEIPPPAYAPEAYASIPDKTSGEEYTGASYGSKEFEMENFNNNNADNTKQDGLGDTRLIGDGNTIKNNYNYGEKNSKDFSNNWSGRKQQGMSDTRFMEKGRFFYDLNMENYRRNEYQPAGRTGYGDSDKDGEYKTQQFDLGDTRFREKSDNNNYENSDEISKNRPGTEQQGMSDTRFMEKGRYFYDANTENYNSNGYKPVSQSHGDFGSSRGVDLRNEGNYRNSFGANDNADEFNNSEGESRYHGENQEEYVP